MDLIVPDSTRSVPAWFSQRLKDADRNLITYFNPMRGRWIIDRCTRMDLHDTHTNECPKTNVMILSDEDGNYLPLCDAALDRILSIDAWRDFGSYEQFQRNRMKMEAEDAAKREHNIDSGYRGASLDNKRQLNEALTLIQRHDVLRINQ
jgi:hypothetical protein